MTPDLTLQSPSPMRKPKDIELRHISRASAPLRRVSSDTRAQSHTLATITYQNCLPRKSKIAGSFPVGADGFSGCGNGRSDDYAAYKTSLEYQYGSGTLGKIKSQQYLASNESFNRINSSVKNWYREQSLDVSTNEMALTFKNLPCLERLSSSPLGRYQNY
ncbi:hypothetical protein TNCV_1665701 [Trichonephila clavipes]|nr:hypothetical protein TNCV_1665701 [Trichonephila clavipes]